MTKFKDYKAPFVNHSQLFGFMMDGKKYYVHEIRYKFMDTIMPQEVIDQFDEASIKRFIEKISGFQNESDLTDYLYAETFDKPEPNSRISNIQFVLNLINVRKQCVPYSKRIVIEKWAEKIIREEKDCLDTSPNEMNNKKDENEKHGAKYARKHYVEIKKILPNEGNVAAAVRAFNNRLSKYENNNISKVIVTIQPTNVKYFLKKLYF